MALQVTEADLARFFQGIRQEQQAARFRRRVDRRRVLAGRVEQQVKAHLESLGYLVSKTGHNERWDLWCEGVRLEVKASHWRGRYQANLRGNDADLLVLGCVHDGVSFFVIPWGEVAGQRALTIRAEDPAATMGRWARYYEAWELVGELVQNPPAGPWQLPLF
jgi:hypothetical protein